jgi:hypothetical protein
VHEEALRSYGAERPIEIIVAANNLITAEFKKKSATTTDYSVSVKVVDIVREYVKLTTEEHLPDEMITSKQSELSNKGWLDIEKVFEDAGWEVKFHSPDYSESYRPYFTFTPKKQ